MKLALAVIVLAVLGAGLLAATPNDTKYTNSEQTYLTRIAAEGMWDYAHGNATTPLKFGLVGTGVGFSAVDGDMDGNIQAEVDFTTYGSARDDFGSNGFSTGTASLIGSETNNSTAMAGLVWDIDIYNIKSIEASGQSTAQKNTDLTEGIAYAIAVPVKVLYIEWAAAYNETDYGDTLSAIDDALAAGITVIVPQYAGTDIGLFGLHDADIVVSAGLETDDDDSTLTAAGSAVDITAPTESITVQRSGGCCFARTASGNSAVLVAGVIAVLRSANVGDWQARNATFWGATDLGTAGKDDTYGWGELEGHCAYVSVFDMNNSNNVTGTDHAIASSHFGEVQANVPWDIDGSGSTTGGDIARVSAKVGIFC